MKGLVAAGDAALEPIRNYCKKAESLNWPLKALREIAPGERFVEEVLSLLDQFDTEYVRNVEPKLQLLKELAEHPSEEVRVAVDTLDHTDASSLPDAEIWAVMCEGKEAAVRAVSVMLLAGSMLSLEDMLRSICERYEFPTQTLLLTHLAAGAKSVSSQQAFDLLALAHRARCEERTRAYFAHVHWEPTRDLERRTASLLPGLTLARVAGKSPVEYLAEPLRDRVRMLAIQLLRQQPTSLAVIATGQTDYPPMPS